MSSNLGHHQSSPSDHVHFVLFQANSSESQAAVQLRLARYLYANVESIADSLATIRCQKTSLSSSDKLRPPLAMIELVIEVAFYISTAVTLFILSLPSQYKPKRRGSGDVSTETKTTAQVLVLGDIGRSPRMQYHALSIARGGGQVDIIGYCGNLCHSYLFRTNSNARYCRIGSSS